MWKKTKNKIKITTQKSRKGATQMKMWIGLWIIREEIFIIKIIIFTRQHIAIPFSSWNSDQHDSYDKVFFLIQKMAISIFQHYIWKLTTSKFILHSILCTKTAATLNRKLHIFLKVNFQKKIWVI